MERVSRQGNASAVNEQTLIFSRTKTHPLPPPIFHRPRARSPYVPELERGESAERRWDDTASAMHTTAIIIVHRRKKDETTTNKRGRRAWVVWREGFTARKVERSFDRIRRQSRLRSLILREIQLEWSYRVSWALIR